MQIEYDEAKRQDALIRHGVDFADAGEIFDGVEFTWQDDRQYDEIRWITFGTLRGRLVVVVWTERNGKRRIISMRKANDREQARYRRTLD